MDRLAVKHLIQCIPDNLLTQYALSDGSRITPSTPPERELQGLWAQALKKDLETIGARDHFFRSGGDSVTVMSMVALARDIGLNLTVSLIFQCPVLSEMASSLEKHLQSLLATQVDVRPFELWSEAPVAGSDALDGSLLYVAAQCNISVGQIEDVYPCTPLQEGLMAITSKDSGHYTRHQVFKMASPVDMDWFRLAWAKAAKLAPILRTRIIFGRQSESLQIVVREEVKWTQTSGIFEYISSIDANPF